MNPDEFLQSLKSCLRQRRVHFDRAAAIAFVSAVWPLIADNPCPFYWSDRFEETHGVAAIAAE
jgi:hypothetical protein